MSEGFEPTKIPRENLMMAAIPGLPLMGGLIGMPLWNLYNAATQGRTYHLSGRSRFATWVEASQQPFFFWYDVITSLLWLGAVISFLVGGLRRVDWQGKE
ncbi:MAG: hypothetical protein JHD15_26210 [Phenylobacterium sp.]|uniref:hypothetical protein n=1 Tax=Phenylobacterium sp. TaxID=1871053 RepID=UPI001A1E3549|nr:hypothetical protein [Phenylobacterium sp.]MBJ7413823.1 hypothetical protein [Phenylobacterium sp.]